jgi:exonuclease SbcD
MRFIDTADWHLTATNRLSDFSNSINQIVSFVKKNEVDFILHAGDVFTKKTPDNAAREVFYKFVKDVSIKVIAIPGNHDSDIHHSLAPLKSLGLDNLIILDTLGDYTFTLEGLPTVSILSIPDLLPRLSTESIEQAIDTFLDVNKSNYKIMLGHFSVIGAQTPNYVVTAQSKEFVLAREIVDRKEFDYIALGHIHLRQDIGNIHYSGGIERVTFGEKDYEPGFYFVETVEKDKRNLTIAKFVPLQVRPMVDLVLDSETFIEQVKALPDNAVVRMFYSNDRQVIALDDIKKLLEAKGCLLKEPVNFIRKSVEKVVEVSSSTNTWEDLIREEIEGSKDLDKTLLHSLFNEALRS